jgi:predicted PurR-regulated permease PerM
MVHLEHRSRVGGWAMAASIAVVALFFYEVHYVLVPFVFAAAVAFVFQPAIDYGRRHTGAPRWVVAAVYYLISLLAFGTILWLLGRAMMSDFAELAQKAPQITEKLMQYLVGPSGINIFGKTYTAPELTREVFNAMGALLGAKMLAGVAGSAFFVIAEFFLTLVLIPFFMISGPKLAAGAVWLLPPERRPGVQSTLEVVAPVLRRYLGGLFLIVIYTTSVAGLGFYFAFGLKHPALLAVTVGLLELLPAIGPITSAALMAVVALEQGSLVEGFELMAFVLALRLSIDNLMGPIFLGQAARVHPVVVIFSMLCGAMLFGIMGVLLAVPVAATIRIVLKRYYAEPIEPASRANQPAE